MPVLSMFYGIIVRMYFFDDKQHHTPHIHIEYGEEHAVFSVPDGELLAGQLTRSKQRLLQAWIELHRDELLADWRLALNGQEPFKIDPLK